jgi:hypothetical protein
VQNVKKMESSSQSNYGNRSENSSQASSREASTSRQQSRDNSQSRNSESPSLGSSTNIAKKSYTDDEIERKAGLTVDEFIQNKDFSEALKDLDEFRPLDNSQYATYYEQLILKVLERSEGARTSVGQLFTRAVIEKKVDIKYLTEAFKSLCQNAEDMAIDVPKIATYLSQLIAPMFHKDVNLNFLAVACDPIKDQKICGELILEILRNASNRMVSLYLISMNSL